MTDALSRLTDQNVDPLNRLSRTLQDTAGLAAQTQFAYDALTTRRRSPPRRTRILPTPKPTSANWRR
ncbi:MAG: hypothetical protein E6Q50_00445 [Lysobacter sp.]|nr:MAG: hypothetical protein E6Q50_00445 [Lysobacter sp.]